VRSSLRPQPTSRTRASGVSRSPTSSR
jgi:hypothetical protein